MRRALIVVLVLAACDGGDGVLLAVDLRTDFVPGVEFSSVRTSLVEVDSERSVTHTVDPAADYVDGVRIAELEGVATGNRALRVELLAEDGRLVASRPVSISIDAGLGFTVVITRDCAGVSCPGPMDAPTATACFGGRCTSSDCSSANVAACGMAECASASECAPGSACATAECADGVCVYRGGGCAAAEYCDPDVGCLSVDVDSGVDASADAGPADSAAGDASIPTGLVSWHTFEGTFEDVTGNGHDATCTSACPTFVPGRDGMAASFDGTQYLTIPHSADYDLPIGFTVALWVQFDVVDRARENVIFSKPVGSVFDNTWMLATRMPSGSFYFYASSSDTDTFAFGPDAVDGRWTHLAGVYDGSSITLYVDGTLAEQNPVSDVRLGTDDILIGAELERDVIDLFIDAQVDDVRVYDHALDGAQVAALAAR